MEYKLSFQNEVHLVFSEGPHTQYLFKGVTFDEVNPVIVGNFKIIEFVAEIVQKTTVHSGVRQEISFTIFWTGDFKKLQQRRVDPEFASIVWCYFGPNRWL